MKSETPKTTEDAPVSTPVSVTHAKFKTGQVVAFASLKQNPVFRIMDVRWDDGWFYQWDRKNYAQESMLRELTPEEKG